MLVKHVKITVMLLLGGYDKMFVMAHIQRVELKLK
jgi:hypothetical protein